MKIKIVSDGTVRGSKVMDAETGEMLSCVQSVEWSVKAGEEHFARATLTVINVPVEIEVDARVEHEKPSAGR
jgi:hypothetical protein